MVLNSGVSILFLSWMCHGTLSLFPYFPLDGLRSSFAASDTSAFVGFSLWLYFDSSQNGENKAECYMEAISYSFLWPAGQRSERSRGKGQDSQAALRRNKNSAGDFGHGQSQLSFERGLPIICGFEIIYYLTIA